MIGGGGDFDALRPPDPRMVPAVSSPAPGTPMPSARDPVVYSSDAGDAGVRPFVITGGRTVPADARLRLETQVVATRAAHGAPLDVDQQRIVDLCRAPRSVAEIGAAVALPLGVARILVADLAVAGHLRVHVRPVHHLSRRDMQRILERVHAL